MNHSLLRIPNETVKLFSYKDPEKDLNPLNSLRMYEFIPSIGLNEITANFAVSVLSTGYYSTEIVTPNKNCYLLILFNGNPIILRVGTPPIQFFYWSKRNTVYPYSHFNEFGDLVNAGNLKELKYGFYYYTPIETDLGYVEVNGEPVVLEYPYSMSASGVGISIDWRNTIIKQQFGIEIIKLNFKLNKINNKFRIKNIINKFNINTITNKFNINTIRKVFKVSCK